jgi:uncharacterized membrane protein
VQSRARVLGEQLNPLLTVLPLGMLGSAVLFDLGALMSTTPFFGRVALWDMAAGLLAGLVAVGATLVDLIVAPSGSSARRVLALEAGTTGSMVLLFGIIWAVRSFAGPSGLDGLFVVEVVALIAGVVGAWFARSIVAGGGLPERQRQHQTEDASYRATSAFVTPHVAPSPYLTAGASPTPSRQNLPSWYSMPTLPGVRPPAIVRIGASTYLVPVAGPVAGPVSGPVGQGSAGASATTAARITPVPAATSGASSAAARAAHASSSAILRANPSLPS